jgi:hypothetical protein
MDGKTNKRYLIFNKIKSVVTILIYLACHVYANSQNNLIFSGGAADGFSMNTHIQNSILNNAVFTGGTADGFSNSSFAQSIGTQNNAVHFGGIADGFSTTSFIQPIELGNAIFIGGIADGFSVSGYTQNSPLGNTIFRGGLADGFAFASVGSLGNEVALPITLVEFDGHFDGHFVQLHWTSATEINNDYFSVERSKDGNEFKIIATVPGAGTKITESFYRTNDEHPLLGVGYYRLRQTDFDKRYTFSKVIMVDSNNILSATVVAYPNPVIDGEFTCELFGFRAEEALNISIFDLLGKVVSRIILRTDDSGFSSTQWHIAEPGIYFISVVSIKGKVTTKLNVR